MKRNIRRFSLGVILAFLVSTIGPIPIAKADGVILPRPGVMVHLSPEFTPAYLKGIVIHPENALKFDFIIYKGDKELTESQKKEEYTKLTKYFLASLAIPDDDQWVNLSPYEKDRIIKDNFGKTEMGRDLLAQDYILKQVTASLIYPEDKLGKKFWDKIYSEAQKQYGTTDIPVNTFNKVWILPDDALIYEKGNTAYVMKNHLKVMLEEDYLALKKHSGIQNTPKDKTHTIASKIVKEIVLPELEREVNEGKNFSDLRQIYSGMLLATWYKQAIKESLLSKVYANKGKVKGIDQDPKTNEEIYQQYLKAYKKGVFNLIKEDVNKYTNESIPRKYFSGGVIGSYQKAAEELGHETLVRATTISSDDNAALISGLQSEKYDYAQVAAKESAETIDAAMNIENKSHPYFGNVLYDASGEEWYGQGGSNLNYVDGKYFLDGFTPNKFVKNPSKTNNEMTTMLAPMNPENERFSNFGAIEGVSAKLSLHASNVNADLGLQEQIRKLISRGLIGEDTFVIVSHGHFLAGLAEVAKAVTPDDKYMFDTAVYLPRGGWEEKSSGATSLVQQQFQFWSESIDEAHKEHNLKGRQSAGGIAVALFGHRGRMDLKTFKTAHINPEELFGSAQDFKDFLAKRGLKKVAILTEEMSLDPDKDNAIPLSRLKEGSFSNDAGEDLYDYMSTLSGAGVDVKVFRVLS